jgi:hypothetical protein
LDLSLSKFEFSVAELVLSQRSEVFGEAWWGFQRAEQTFELVLYAGSVFTEQRVRNDYGFH